MPVNGCGAPHHIRIAVEFLFPITVVQDHHRVLARNLALAAQKESPRGRLQSETVKKVSTHIGSHDSLRLLVSYRESIERDCVRKDVAERTSALGANLLELRPREGLLQRSAVLAQDQRGDLFGVGHGERLDEQ